MMSKLKILYAATNNSNSKIQLSRFLDAMDSKSYIIKIAAFKASSPKNQGIDWTLDCLYNIYKPDYISLENENFDTYYQQVKYYNPDLIISDLEYFTSYIANSLNITLWQCSSSLINFAVEHKYNVGLFKRYSYLLKKNNTLRTQRIVNIIDNSNCNFVYSHLGDTIHPPALKGDYQWIRPYHTVGKESIPCRHNLVAGLLRNDKKIMALLKNHEDSVAFTEFPHERHANLWLKDIGNQQEYVCNLRNCNLFLCEGQTSFLADAFYNKKYSVVMTNFNDVECVTNSLYSEYLKLGTTIYQIDKDLEPYLQQTVQVCLNEQIQYLHEKVVVL
jgi:uncharacterized protein (TIGR00661 family)